MEDLQIFKNFSVKSKVIGHYNVKYINNLDVLHNEIENQNKLIYIIDEKVFDLFYKNKSFKHVYIKIKADELNKTIDYSKWIISKLLELNIRKDIKIVAIGGGVTQDLVAFISSILFRGIEWIFVPTTLLAQCDSCIGSKSSINFMEYKNLVGGFYPPSSIYICNSFLSTLSEPEIKSGIGEMLHYFLTDGVEIANKLNEEYEMIFKNRQQILYYVAHSLNIKKKIIEIDEFDTNIRHIFNYGHTFGHAIESLEKFKIQHGICVTIGIAMANFLAFRYNYINEEVYKIHYNVISKNIIPYQIKKNNLNNFKENLKKDKKNIDNKLGCILPIGLGKVKKIYLNFDESLDRNILDFNIK